MRRGAVESADNCCMWATTSRCQRSMRSERFSSASTWTASTWSESLRAKRRGLFSDSVPTVDGEDDEGLGEVGDVDGAVDSHGGVDGGVVALDGDHEGDQRVG